MKANIPLKKTFIKENNGFLTPPPLRSILEILDIKNMFFNKINIIYLVLFQG